MERFLLAYVAAAITGSKDVFDRALVIHAWAEEQANGLSDRELAERSNKALKRNGEEA